jgi:hypothetical protein
MWDLHPEFMHFIARNFQFYPTDSKASTILGNLVRSFEGMRFPVSIGVTNSNQFTFDFDSALSAQLERSGAELTHIRLPTEITKECDFAFVHQGNSVVVEVEKANAEKILYDLLKFHMYFRAGADLGLLVLPCNWPHSRGERDLFRCGVNRYDQCIRFGFGASDIFDRILLVGYEQFTDANSRVSSVVRQRLIEASTVDSPTVPESGERHRGEDN